MRITVQKIDQLKRKLNIEVDSQTLAKDRETLYREVAKSLKVPGFRPGMAPAHILEKHHGNLLKEEFLRKKEFLHYSRIPVYSENNENITGYIFRQTVFEKLAEKEVNLKLRDISREIVIAHQFQTLLGLWEVLLENKEHIALIVDEYGGMDGIVTMEDIIEAILGLEIVDERDRIMNMQHYARERWNERKAKYNILDISAE